MVPIAYVPLLHSLVKRANCKLNTIAKSGAPRAPPPSLQYSWWGGELAKHTAFSSSKPVLTLAKWVAQELGLSGSLTKHMLSTHEHLKRPL